MSAIDLRCGRWQDVLADVGEVDAVICDPPYAEIDRPYGRMSEAEWMAFMRRVTLEARRVLRPHGSAVFILQPNSEKVGKMRGWLWRYLAWCVDEWNVVQDAYWWNPVTQPTVHTHRTRGLMRSSVKSCVWLGSPGCYRDQGAVLWSETESNIARRAEQRFDLVYNPSGSHNRPSRVASVAGERGGVTPYNILPISNSNSTDSAGAHGHGAGTPYRLAEWWTKYLTKPGDTVLDMCMGSGTMGLAALNLGRAFVGIEQDAAYFAIAQARIDAAAATRQMSLEEAA